MSENTPTLDLPYLMPAQAQKHVTHNQALSRLDAVTQLVLVAEQPAPPEAPREGDCFAVATDATGGWIGREGKIATWQDGAWLFLSPKTGWRAYMASENGLRIYSEGRWQRQDAQFEQLGINATADSTNRLAISAPATLFNHEGSDHRLIVNRQSNSDTAALLLQTNWQGQAEIGLAGNDRLAIKISADGSNWLTALDVTATGVVTMPQRPLASAALDLGVLSPASGSQTGFDTLLHSQGGVTLGTQVPGGIGRGLTVPSTGIYMLDLFVTVTASSAHTITVLKNQTNVIMSVAGDNDSGTPRQYCVHRLSQLEAGDRLTTGFSGDAEVDSTPGKTGFQIHLI